MYMFLPRTSAIAEASWSHTNKDFERYTTNLNNLVKFYDAYGYNYAKSFWREGK
jgi:hexosaminidase